MNDKIPETCCLFNTHLSTTASDTTRAQRIDNTLCMLLRTLPNPLLLYPAPWVLDLPLHRCL